jgi:hypothetical protein
MKTMRVLATKAVEGGSAELRRTGLGQVVEYDVYVRFDADGSEMYLGGGTKREARRLYNKVKEVK